jgi:hypothetical protein
MSRQLLLIICPFFILLQSNSLSAQKIDSVLGIYSDRFQQEKMYLHFDKSLYNKGETIWFKAYVLAGTDLTDYSKTVYVDWYDAGGKLLKHVMAPMFESSARGQFEIPAGYTGQSLHVRAYTQWMLNFDPAFLYNKDIPVSQSKVEKVSPVSPVTTLQFFPEGGDWVSGIISRMAFMAVNSRGLPVKVSGAIKTSTGTLMDSFVTVHDGMGSFLMEPQPNETYTATWTDESGKVYTTPLPLCKNTGAVLQVQPLATKTMVEIKRTAVAEDNIKTLNLVAHMNQQVVYRSRVNLTVRTGVVAEIPTGLLPTGVLQITLLDRDWLPLAERVVFINNHQYQFHPEISVAVKGLEKRSKNVVEISVPDSTISNLSVAVTDGGLSVDSSNTIISQLLLCGDIKGYIHHPAYYFSEETDSISEHLDLVMLTHGWRRFKWEDIKAEKLPVIQYPRNSDFMQLKGRAFGASNIKIQPNQKIILILQAKDSSKQTLFLPVKADGTFAQDEYFFDSLKVYYRLLGDKKLANRTELVFQTGLLPRPKNLVDYTSPYLWQVDTAGLSRARYFAAEQARMEQLAKSTTLADVVVKTRAKRPEEILDEKYASGMFSGGMDGYSFDIINDVRAQSSMDIFHYLQGMVAGLQLQMSSGGQWTLTWRNARTQLFLDEVPVSSDQLSSMPISDIAYVKVFRPPFYGASGGGAGGAVAVHTRRGGDVQNTPGRGGLDYKLLEGYTLYKEFYSPDYSQPTGNFLPDVRTTIYWNPYVLTDSSTHKVNLVFYNNDISKTLHVVLEGMNADGQLARVEKIIE